jgi:hypothetical protein
MSPSAVDLVVLALAVAFTINDHARGLGIGALENAVEDELQMIQRLAAATDEAAGIGSRNVQQRRAVLRVVLDLGFQLKRVEDLLENFLGIQWCRGSWRNGKVFHDEVTWL